MTQLFLRIYDRLSQHRWLPVAMVVLLLAACLFLSSRMDYEEDISAFLPQTAETEEYTTIYAEMGGQDRVAVVFRGDSANIIPAMDSFGECLVASDTTGMVHDLQVNVDEEQVMDVMAQVWQTYPLLLTDADYAHMDSLLTADYVRQAMADNHRLMMLPIGNVMTQSLPYDPLHLSARITNQLRHNPLARQYQVIDGHIFTKDGQCGLVLLSSPFGISESHGNELLEACLSAVADSVQARYPGVEISCVGAPLIAVGNAKQIKHDSILAVSLSVLLIFAVLYYSFRRWRDIWLIGLSIAFGWIVAVGCLALFSERMSIIVLGIGSVIVGIAANYPLHFLDHLKHEPSRRSALKEMTPPLLIGNITTVSAFLCLVCIEARAMRDLGLFGSLMLVGTILFVLVFLPCLAGTRSHGGKVHPILPNVRWSVPQGVRRALLPLVVVLTCVLGYLSLDTQFDPDMQHINYMTPAQRTDIQLLSQGLETHDTLTTMFVVARGDNLEEALSHNEALQAHFAHQPAVHSIAGIGQLMPSPAQAADNLRRWNNFWAQHQDILRVLRDEAREKGFAEEAFMPFYALCEGDVAHTLADNPIRDTWGKHYLLQDSTGQVRVVNILQVTTSQAEGVKQQLRADIQRQGPDAAFVFDSKDVSNSMVTILSDSFNYIGFVCGFVVFAFLWLSFGRLELTCIAFLPLAVSWLWILGMMNIAQVQFNIVNIILATFIFGQGDDYSIFITEGMVYEYTYGKKRLQTYKNSVALSAVLMFIGIGSLIFAKHPAMRSLAQVAMIGMVTVVLMTFYLPPLVFRWLTTKHGVTREVPITLQRLLYSLWAITFFLVFSLLVFVPYACFHLLFLSHSRRCQYFFHRMLQRVSRFVIYRVPGVRFRCVNPTGENLERPAVIICNHQSHLDVMCLLMLSPRIVILTNDWVWHNPFYGAIIRAAEFYPVSDGWDKNLDRLRSLVDRGYSVVVFPEGTREYQRGIMRFHKGAFSLAQQLGVDIVPIMLHGLVDVLPKRDFMLRRGTVTMQVYPRVPAARFLRQDARALTREWHAWYVTRYQEMSRQCEDTAYWLPYVRYKYMYKSHDAERRSMRILRGIARGTVDIRQWFTDDGRIVIPHSGQGEAAWIAALSHPDRQVYAYETDEDMHALACHIAPIPSNLHFICGQCPSSNPS